MQLKSILTSDPAGVGQVDQLGLAMVGIVRQGQITISCQPRYQSAYSVAADVDCAELGKLEVDAASTSLVHGSYNHATEALLRGLTAVAGAIQQHGIGDRLRRLIESESL